MGLELKRGNILTVSVILISALLTIRLFDLQIVDKEYKITASNNAFRYEVRYPARGLVLDRYGKILVGNETAYDIMVTPYEAVNFDTVDLCGIFDLNLEDVRKTFKEYRINRRKIGFQTMPFVKRVSNKQYAVFLEQAL